MDGILPVVLAMLVLGIVTLVALVVLRSRSTSPARDDAIHNPSAALGMSVGMLLGGILGVIVWVSTGEFVFWVIFLGGGMTVGLAAGTGMASRSR